MNVTFRKIIKEDIATIFSWLKEPHIMASWDNTQAHKDDIQHFVEGRKTPSSYAEGKYVYWLALDKEQPFAFIMTINETIMDDINQIKKKHLSQLGTTYGIDYMIGDAQYVGRGYGAHTLSAFIDFFCATIDKRAHTFFIDPAIDNPIATHVYLKAGFTVVADFQMEGNVSGQGKMHHLLVKKQELDIQLLKAEKHDAELLHNLTRFYFYDLSRSLGHMSDYWTFPNHGLYQGFDVSYYFNQANREPLLIKVNNEIAGFILLTQLECDNGWHIDQFFIVSKFQNRGIGKHITKRLWDSRPGAWQLSIVPENQSAIIFWEKRLKAYRGEAFKKTVITIDYDKAQPKRYFYSFNSADKSPK